MVETNQDENRPAEGKAAATSRLNREGRWGVASARKDEIAGLAEAVADEHCPTGRIAPERIARAKRITMSFGQYGDAFDGMLEHRAQRFHIFCNLGRAVEADSPRARFTLAHELGHYYIDEHRGALADGRTPAHRSHCDYESRNLAEQEADHFAANLLMPARRFALKAKGAQGGLDGVIGLADAFGVSLTAAAIRYATCDIAPCAVIKWNWNKYAWKQLSSSAFRARYRRTVEAPDKLPPDSPTARALAGEKPGESGYFQAGTTAATWFPGVPAGEYRDIIFIEQAITLGRFGVLTFLHPQAGDLPTCL